MLLVDGYNLILGDVVGDIEAARDLLLRDIDGHCRRVRTKAIVVFDAGRERWRRKQTHSNAVTAIFAARGETADDVVIELIRGTKDRTRYTVVSSDGEIAAAARQAEMRCVRADEFLQELRRPAPGKDPRRQGISPAEADEWMRIFGLNDRSDRG